MEIGHIYHKSNFISRKSARRQNLKRPSKFIFGNACPPVKSRGEIPDVWGGHATRKTHVHSLQGKQFWLLGKTVQLYRGALASAKRNRTPGAPCLVWVHVRCVYSERAVCRLTPTVLSGREPTCEETVGGAISQGHQ